MVQKKDFDSAVKHYSKSLFAMKMIFENENNIIKDQETAIKYIKEIELPVCLNLCHCYLKLEQYHFVIKYST